MICRKYSCYKGWITVFGADVITKGMKTERTLKLVKNEESNIICDATRMRPWIMIGLLETKLVEKYTECSFIKDFTSQEYKGVAICGYDGRIYNGSLSYSVDYFDDSGRDSIRLRESFSQDLKCQMKY